MARRSKNKEEKKKKSLLGRLTRFVVFVVFVAGGLGVWAYLQPRQTAADALAEAGTAQTPEGWLLVIDQGFDLDLGDIVLVDETGGFAPACQAPPGSEVPPTRKEERIDYEQVIETSSALGLGGLVDKLVAKVAGSEGGGVEQAYRSSAKIRVKVDWMITEHYYVEQLGHFQGILSQACSQAVEAHADQTPFWALGVRRFRGVEVSLLDERGNVLSVDGEVASGALGGEGSFELGQSGSFSFKTNQPMLVCVKPWKFVAPEGRNFRLSGGGRVIEATESGAFSSQELAALQRKMRGPKN